MGHSSCCTLSSMIFPLLLSLMTTVHETQASCQDQGCHSSLQGEGQCVDVRGADWAELDFHYSLNETINSHNLCEQSGPDHCCMCLKKKASCSDQGCSITWGGLGVCGDVREGCCTCFKKQDHMTGYDGESGHHGISEPSGHMENSGSNEHTEHHEHWEDYSPNGESGHHEYHESSEQHDHEDHFGQYDYSEHAESHGLIEHHRHQGESVHYHKHGGHYHRHRGDFGVSGNSGEYQQTDKELSKIVDDIFG